MTEEQPTDVVETPAEPRGSLRERWVPLGLVLGGGVWNFFSVGLGDTVDWGDWWSMPICYVIGTIVAHPLPCAVWGACASQVWYWRLLLGTAASCFLCLTIATDGDVLTILVFFMPLYFVFLVVLALLRWKFRIVLGTRVTSSDGMSSNSSFGLGYLFAWMSVVAILTGFGRWMAGETDQSSPDIEETAMFILMYSALLAPPAWILLNLLRTSRVRSRTLLLMAFSVPLATLGATIVITRSEPSYSFWNEGFWPLLFYCLGAMFTVTLVAIALRWAGYRLSSRVPSP